MRYVLALLAALAVLGVSGASAAELDERRALAKAVEILKGDPYGGSKAEVVAHIGEKRLTARHHTVCGGGANRVWAFHVVVPKPKTNPEGVIDGWLVIDATSGRIVCATLPFLD